MAGLWSLIPNFMLCFVLKHMLMVKCRCLSPWLIIFQFVSGPYRFLFFLYSIFHAEVIDVQFFFFYNIIVWKISGCVDRVRSGYDVMQLRIMCKKWISPSLEWNESVYEKLGDDGDDTKQHFQTKALEFLQAALKQMHLSKYRRLNWMRQLICLYAVVISKPACGWGKKNKNEGKHMFE